MDEKWVMAGEAIAWIASRDNNFAARCRDESIGGISSRLSLEFGWHDGNGLNGRIGPFHNGETAAWSLVRACRRGEVAASGFKSQRRRGAVGEREAISPGDWSDLWLTADGGRIIAASETKEGRHTYSDVHWHDVRFAAEELLEAFPPQLAGSLPTLAPVAAKTPTIPPNAKPGPGRKRGNVSLALADAPFVHEMHQLITADATGSTSIFAAASKVVDRAPGAGSRESKVDRLRRRYAKTYSD
jgi:hypothetical protein